MNFLRYEKIFYIKENKLQILSKNIKFLLKLSHCILFRCYNAQLHTIDNLLPMHIYVLLLKVQTYKNDSLFRDDDKRPSCKSLKVEKRHTWEKKKAENRRVQWRSSRIPSHSSPTNGQEHDSTSTIP